MKKLYFLKTMLLLCALVVGSSSVWAQETKTATLEITSSVTSTGDLTDNSSNTWAFTTDGTLTANNSYIQAGTNKSEVSYIKLSTSAFSNKIITKVQVWGTSKANTGVTAKVKIGSTTIGTSSEYTTQNASSGGTEYSVDNTDEITGDLSIEISRSSSATGAIYFNKAIVTYKEASSDPSSDVAFTNTTPSINFPATKTYSQVATTAAGYTGTVTYEITANTAGATIEGSTVTVTQGGSVTVKATAPATTGFKKSEATYTLTVNDTRTTPGLAWSASTASVTYGTTPYSFPTLANDHGVSVNYESTNESVATINSNGDITIKNVTGNTTIKAVFEANDDYLAQTVSYTLNVTKAEIIEDGVFDFTGNLTYNSGMSPSSSSTYTTVKKTWTAGNVTLETEGAYRYWYNANGNSLRLYNNNPASSLTISVPDGYVITDIVVTGGGKSNLATADNAYSNGNWSGAAQSIKLTDTSTGTVTIETITVTYTSATKTATVTAAGWKTYAPDYAVSFREGTKAYIITAASSSGATLTPVTSVPANTAVLLEGTKGSEVTHTMDVVGTSSTNVSSNCLHVSDGTAKDNIYVLADGDFGVGFYRWIGTSALTAGKIYMQIPNASRAFISLDGETAGIDAIQTDGKVLKNEVYNLSGQRVAQPTKGLYIVNGKKVIKN